MGVEPREDRMWTVRLRRSAARPSSGGWRTDRLPAYVTARTYVFGTASAAALLVVLGSGLALTVLGQQWYHSSPVGRFMNSVHLWSAELFLLALVLHLLTKFFTAAWRGRRALTWMAGAIAFLGSTSTAFTGYLIQANLYSQWMASRAKNGMNSVGIGAWFNVLDYGQMLLLHVAFLPAVVGLLVLWHLWLVRRHGPVPPYAAGDDVVVVDAPESAA